MNKIIKISLITTILMTSSFANEPFLSSLKKNNEDIVSEYMKEEKKETKTKSDLEAESLKKQIAYTKAELEKRKLAGSFSLQENKVNVQNGQKWVKLKIPVNQISDIVFDKKVKTIETMENQAAGIQYIEPFKIVVKNKDFDLQQSIKVVFLDDSVLNLLLTIGTNPAERHVSHLIYTDSAAKAMLPEFQKKLKIKSVQNYFNNVALKLISDRLLLTEDFEEVRKNAITIPSSKKKVFSGKSKIADLGGLREIEYTLNLEMVYETAYVEDADFNRQKRLVLQELTIQNDSSSNVLVVSEELVKNRFPNYVSFYVGNIEEGENKLVPGDKLRFLIVTEELMEK